MFRDTFAIAIILLGFWGIGVWTLAAGTFDDENGIETAALDSSMIRIKGATVWMAHQDLSGKYTVYLRSPGRVSRI